MTTDTIDLTLLAGKLASLERDSRLIRLQLDNLVLRGTLVDQRLSTLESAMHGLAAEMAKDFGQIDQRLMRIDQRLDAISAGLDGIRAGVAEVIAAVTGRTS